MLTGNNGGDSCSRLFYHALNKSDANNETINHWFDESCVIGVIPLNEKC